MKGIIDLNNPHAQSIHLTGGKASNLSKLTHLNSIQIPKGFVITTNIFKELCLPIITPYILALQRAHSQKELLELGTVIRKEIMRLTLSPELINDINQLLTDYPPNNLFAVRSSATTEDLPDNSFAGQQDSYLNIPISNIPNSIIKCYASLYNDSAIAYRNNNNFPHSETAIAVIVQEMVPSQVSGVLFTADPITSDRCTCVIEAVNGLGDDLVSGRKTPYTWKVRKGQIRSESNSIPPLAENELHTLTELGKSIEKYFKKPQDIEWCYMKNQFYFVQSRAITTLYPLPVSRDGKKRFFVSTGHMQMMTDTILPLGISFMDLISYFKMEESGGRLYIDITNDMKTLYGRKMIKTKLSAMDPLIYEAAREVMKDKNYLKSIPKGPGSFSSFNGWVPMLIDALRIYQRNDPSDIDGYISRMRRSVRLLSRTLVNLRGIDGINYIINDQKALLDILNDFAGFGMVLVSQYALFVINSYGKKLTGEENLSNRLSKSVKHNISSEMGLALSELCDKIREYPKIIDVLEEKGKDFTIDDLRRFGCDDVVKGFKDFLNKYGMRGTGEIDITKTRFREQPGELTAVILSNIRSLPKGYAKSSFDTGEKETRILIKKILKKTDDEMGKRKADRLKKHISIFRNFVGIREYPKYFWICRYDIYKKYLMREAKILKAKGIIADPTDIFYLYLDEIKELIRTEKVNYSLILSRKEEYKIYSKLTPPRVIFSDGEVPIMKYKKKIPTNAMGGLSVSGGIVEGRARVIHSVENADIEKGDILVTPFTDPSWTPVFVSIAGLVTEVGGMMTHGAVITREYGLPAVVGVIDATKKIPDKSQIRLNGDEGYVEIIS